ncbi:cohesin complex subunit [Knufia obscura]|uniref:Cohesin complex subunit n=1 Tax=Knufia obscura TaxID=1635080 RepID=A0ABR0RCR4_9EURO|nr:cohesin complex subunit [Knufia obscura]
MATAIATPVANGADRRRSGRATHAPPVFSQEQHHGSVIDSAKRKRPAEATNDDDEVEDEEEPEEETEEEEAEPDEEELREQRRKQRSKQPVAKPATKRPKTTTGASTTLAIRSANVPSKAVSKTAKQKARSRQSQIQGTGLYADVFGKGLSAEEAANTWHNFLEGDHVGGMRDMVNFVLQVAGCDERITNDDINDVDHVHERLGDILAEYANQKPGDYPLSGKQKQFYGMKEVFSEFFRAIPRALHNSSLMYEETPIYENLHIWIATMAGASYRSFRHTATTASLAMTTGQTELAKELQKSIATTKQQLDNEKKKKSANKSRLTKLQEEMEREEKKLDQIDSQLKDAFDTVYVHRYRDVEERLRAECAIAMGTWILNYPTMFLEGQYLRYIGWVMSDPHAPTRLEVMRQLKKMYAVRSNRGNLRSFTDRFRKRMVEMGARDADLNVRVESIEFLNQLRSLDLLEPEDIDTVGQLVFDNEPRVRKAVAQFFVSNIEDLYAASVEDFDAEQFNDALPDADSVDDPADPSKLWIKFKCLAQTLGAQTKDLPDSTSRKLEISGIDHLDSRYMVATQAIFSSMPELQEWESLAGYLLFDHSSIKAATDAADVSAAVQEAYKLEEGEDAILLDVLFCAARLSLQETPSTAQKGKKLTKADKDQLRAKQETAAHNLSVFIPQLHNKFGSDPQAARSILRLHQLFDPDLVDDVDEGDGDQGALLDDVNKQFTTHSDAEVLAEASRALRSALGHESSKEAADKKVDELWHDLTSQTLASLILGQNVSQRGTLDREKTRQLADVTGRLAQLASVRDCCEVIEGKMTWQVSKSKRKTNETVMDIVLQLVKRGEPGDDTPREAAALEDQTCRFALRILSLYYRWKVVAIRNAIVSNDKSTLSIGLLTNLAMRKNDFVEALLPIITSRKALDSVRTAAILSLIDLYVLFATLRHAKPSKGELDDDVQANLESLVTELSGNAMTAIMQTHEKMERRLAGKTNKRNLEFPLAKAQKASKRSRRDSATPAVNGNEAEDDAVDRPPEDSDDEDAAGRRNKDSDNESSSDDGDDVDSSPEEGGSMKEAKKKAALVAETSLCELTAKVVLALLAGVVPKSNEVRARLQINRTKLGKSYTQVIAYLDEKKEKTKSKSKGAAAPKTPVKKAAAKKSAPVVEPMELSDDEIEDDEQREEGDPEALREQGLEDDPVEEANDEAEDVNEPAREDEIMGD